MKRMTLVALAGTWLVTATLAFGPGVAVADSWEGPFTPTSAQAQHDVVNGSNLLAIYVSISQPVVSPNPSCTALDGYMANDPVITNQILAMALTALATGASIKVYVSSTQCVDNRPAILNFVIE